METQVTVKKHRSRLENPGVATVLGTYFVNSKIVAVCHSSNCSFLHADRVYLLETAGRYFMVLADELRCGSKIYPAVKIR